METSLANKKIIVITSIVLIIGILVYGGWRCIESQYTIPPALDSLEKSVLRSGNVEAYHNILFYYREVGLNYAFIMANKYDYLPACEDIYHMLMRSVVDSLYTPDKKTAQLAIEYLKYAADKRNKDACLLLSEEYMYGTNIEKDTLEGLRYYFYYCNSDSNLYNQSLPFYQKMLYNVKTEDDDYEERIEVTPMKYKNNPYYRR